MPPTALPTRATPTAPPPGRTSLPEPTSELTPVPLAAVPIELATNVIEVAAGQEFEVQVKINAGESNPVDTAQVYLDFDSAKLDVVSVKAGSRLRYVLQNEAFARSGHIGFAAGTTGAAQVAPFVLCTITFRARGSGGKGETGIGFAPRRAPRHTKAISRGVDVTGDLSPLLIAVE